LVKVLDSATAPMVLRNDGSDTTVTVTSIGVPSEPVPAGGNGYAITRSYFTMEGEPMTLDGLTAGTRFVTVLTVTPFGRGEAHVMVNDPLPAGLEIDNPNLVSSATDAMAALGLESDVAHSEFRQDRFLTAIDRYSNKPFKLGYVVRAISPGVFHQPAATVEDMYRPDLTGRTDAGTVTIAE
jgi:alpha-2-macroglobulin